MTDRTTVSVEETAHTTALGVKDDLGLTWSEFLIAAADALESQDDEMKGKMNACDVLTTAHIDDIGAEVERRVERAVENTLTRR